MTGGHHKPVSKMPANQLNSNIKIAGIEEVSTPRPKRLNQIIILLALALVLNAVFVHLGSKKQELLKVGDHVPDFRLEAVGGTVVGNGDLKGKPAVYFFYADWCPCSHQSVGWIKKAREEYKGSGMAFIAVGIQDSSDNLRGFAKKYGLDFPVSVTGGDDVAGSMGVKTTPTTIFADGGGIVRSIFVGKIEKYDQISGGLKSILASSDKPASG